MFTDIDEIAHSGDLLKERKTSAERRIDEFESDLAKQRLRPGLAEKIRDRLQGTLEAVVRNRDLIGDFDSVFTAALDRLTGEQG